MDYLIGGTFCKVVGVVSGIMDGRFMRKRIGRLPQAWTRTNDSADVTSPTGRVRLPQCSITASQSYYN